MLKCKEACILLSESQDRRLSMRERLSVVMHLAVCPSCRCYRSQLAFIRRNIKEWQQHGH
ncbi:zf-HC2 domain-containing protein [Neisseria musculi]|uniref:Zinc-finger family protein n=1 Tax=Neisseria musculi TaxID=1815583 RepID=A0A7H1MDQ5_9NEIS|nr:zinc-finger family protein [Neisseria musculi]